MPRDRCTLLDPDLVRVLVFLSDIRDRRFGRGRACPRCGSSRVVRWGRFSGRQRYRCKACRRTFSDLTGTPMAYTKRLSLWANYCACMMDGQTVRASARRVGIHRDTAFRWRHRLLGARPRAPLHPLCGVVEVLECQFPYSEKGRRRPRPPRERRRWRARQRCARRVRVLLVQDRRGGRWSGLVGERAAAEDLTDPWGVGPRPRFSDPACDESPETALAHVAPGGIVVGMRGVLCRESAAVRRLGLRYRQAGGRLNLQTHPSRPGLLGHSDGAPRGHSHDPGHHVANIRAYSLRLRGWMPRFRGVATRYLRNYLMWFEWVDGAGPARFTEEMLRWELGGEHGAGGRA